MGDVDAPVERARPPEHDIVRTRLVNRHDILDAVEPHQVDDALPVGEVGHQAAFPPLAFRVETQDLPADLHVGHVRCQLMDVIQARAVDMLVREGIKQIMKRTDLQLIRQQLCPFGTHSRQKFHILTLQIHHMSNR